MSRYLAAAILALGLLGCSKGASQDVADGAGAAAEAGQPGAPHAKKLQRASKALPPGVWRVQQVQIVDPGGFGAPMVASTMLIPAGWMTHGGIVWGAMPKGCGADDVADWQAVAPDGVNGFALIPTPSWRYIETGFGAMTQAQSGDCPIATFTTTREYLEAFIRRLHPDAQVKDYRPRPDRLKQMQDFYQYLPVMQGVPGMNEQRKLDAGELLVTYQMNGQPVDALVGTSTVATLDQWTDRQTGQISQRSLTGAATGVYMLRAPAGQLDPKLVDLMLKSQRATPEWGTKTFEHNMQKIADGMKASHDFHVLEMDKLRAQAAIINGSYRDQNLASDHNQREFIETVRGVETYYDPVDKSPVQLDYNYKDAWRINDGSYVLTNDPSFDPQKYNLDGVQLKIMP